MIVISWSETHSAETLDDLSLQPSRYLKVSEEQLTSGWWNSMITIIYPKLSWMMLMMMMMMMMINEWSASLSNHLSLTSMFFNTSPVFSPSQKISNRKSTMFLNPPASYCPLAVLEGAALLALRLVVGSAGRGEGAPPRCGGGGGPGRWAHGSVGSQNMPCHWCQIPKYDPGRYIWRWSHLLIYISQFSSVISRKMFFFDEVEFPEAFLAWIRIFTTTMTIQWPYNDAWVMSRVFWLHSFPNCLRPAITSHSHAISMSASFHDHFLD